MRIGRIACCGLLLALAGAGAPAKQSAPPLKDWITGPIRYLARSDEAKRFKSFDNDGDRALFIEKFWARRDPSPDTLTNEYRQMFWNRVREANQSFHGSTRPGWMTDRGKIYILYGPPTEVKEVRDLPPDALTGGGLELMRWIYEGRPGNRVDLDPITVVAFVRDYTGEYRLSSDPRLASVFFDEDLLRRSYNGWSEAFLPRRSELSVMLDMGKLQEVPPEEQVLLERVETVESYRTRPLSVSVVRYRHPDKTGALMVLTLDISHVAPGGMPAVIARFTPRDATAKPRIIGEGSFRVEATGERRVAQGRIVLPPGTYDLMVLAADPFDASTGLYRGVVVVLPETDALRLSDVILAERLEPLPYRALASHDEPFLIGPFKVVPRMDPSLPKGGAVDVFFEVYGGQPPYRIRYRLEGRDDDGSWVGLGRPQTGEAMLASQAWGLPTGDAWPLGEYRVQIEVSDASEQEVRATLPFSLAEGVDE